MGQPCPRPGPWRAGRSPARRRAPRHTGSSRRQPSSLRRDAGESPPCACHSLVVPTGGTGVPPDPSLSLCHLCFAVTDRQAPAHRTINYSHALFLNIDVKSKFLACPSPTFQIRFSRHKDPSSRRAIERCRRGEGGTSTATSRSADTGSGVCDSGSAGEASPRTSDSRGWGHPLPPAPSCPPCHLPAPEGLSPARTSRPTGGAPAGRKAHGMKGCV